MPECFRTIKLYKIEDGDVSVVGEAPLKQEMLESDVSKYLVLTFDIIDIIFRTLSSSMVVLKESLSGLEG